MAAKRKRRKEAPPINETWLEKQSRLARLKDATAQATQPLVTPEAARQGDYHEAWTEVDGRRAKVVLNRGGTTIQRWMNAAVDDVLGDSERAAIRYCQALWRRLDRKEPVLVRVDGGVEGAAEHEALAELSVLKRKLPLQYWAKFENICRFDQEVTSRHDRVTVGFVAAMIAQWRGL